MTSMDISNFSSKIFISSKSALQIVLNGSDMWNCGDKTVTQCTDEVCKGNFD